MEKVENRSRFNLTGTKPEENGPVETLGSIFSRENEHFKTRLNEKIRGNPDECKIFLKRNRLTLSYETASFFSSVI
jgi:hypothetical protein